MKGLRPSFLGVLCLGLRVCGWVQGFGLITFSLYVIVLNIFIPHPAKIGMICPRISCMGRLSYWGTG